MGVEVRAVGEEAFEDVYPLLRGFPTKEMSKEDWRQMLFAYPWADTPKRGFALYADGKAVGFIGTIFSSRHLAGQVERICSLSSWIVAPEYRGYSMMLVTPIMRIKDCTILNPTPSKVAYDIFHKMRFLPLESERLILPPIPRLAEAARTLSGSFVRSRAGLERELKGQERALYDAHAKCVVAKHVLLRRGGRQCYVVATPVHKKGIAFAEIQHISDLDFFWDNRILAHAALLPSRAVGLWVDKRFVGDRRPPVGMRWPAPRLYRPTRKEITPDMIDGLYSELVNLRW